MYRQHVCQTTRLLCAGERGDRQPRRGEERSSVTSLETTDVKGFSDGNVFNEMDVGRQFRRTSMGPVWNRIRNRVSVPVGVCFPGFLLSHHDQSASRYWPGFGEEGKQKPIPALTEKCIEWLKVEALPWPCGLIIIAGSGHSDPLGYLHELIANLP